MHGVLQGEFNRAAGFAPSPFRRRRRMKWPSRFIRSFGPGRIAALALAAVAAAALGAGEARAQWSTTYEQFYLQAKHNWQFRERYQAADRLFNAFDFGHAILYETLWNKPTAPATELEQKWYDRLTKRILVNPPHVPLEEGAIEIAYAKLAPEAKVMFEWAHILHRQIYDVLADERLTQAQKDAQVARLLAYYRTRPDVAFSSRPKSMALMQEQPYSLAFRQTYPKFNGLIWAYHWLQVGLYEPLLVNATSDARQAGVRATVARFWQQLESPPTKMPHVMPMTAAVAPTFAQRYPEAAIIFDNLHSMHDVISDILANPSVPRDRKRAEILLAARRFRDDMSFVMPLEAWRTMAHHMGVENMGGPAVNFLPQLPTPAVTYGAVMTHDERTGEMTGFKYGQATGGAHAGMQHGAPGADSARARPADHAAMGHGAAARDTSRAGRAAARQAPGHEAHGGVARPGAIGRDTAAIQHQDDEMMELHMRMLDDPVILRRILADTAMRRMMTNMIQQMPEEHRTHMESMLREPTAGAARPAARTSSPAARSAQPRRTTAQPRRATTRPSARSAQGQTKAAQPAAKRPAARPAPQPARKPASKPADPHAGHRPPA
jgi:hypothetical protein